MTAQWLEPLHNPLGFGAQDFFLLAWTLLFGVFALLWRPFLERPLARLAERKWICASGLFTLCVILRLALLPHHPVPYPTIYDEFSHLLAADTLRHFRFANPPHEMRRFFETFFVLQEPTYSSIYPIGQGLVLALAWNLFGSPWVGVVITTAALCALVYWMLRGWVEPGWALAGGILALIEFGPLNPWMNNYWGGAVAASAGCLVFGALPRLREQARIRDGLLLGSGLGLHLLTRPYESVFLSLSILVYFAPALFRQEKLRPLKRPALFAAIPLLLALVVTGIQNKQVTGAWLTTPYQLSQYQYGVPASLTFQQNPVPHRQLTAEQALDYRMQSSFRSAPKETLGSYWIRLEYRVRFYRFYLLPPLYLAVLAFLVRLRRYEDAWIVTTLAMFALGTNFFPSFQLHYIAAATCLFVLISVKGLRVFRKWNAGPILFFLCVLHFAFWYGLHLCEDAAVSQALLRYETWTGLNSAQQPPRAIIERELEAQPGKQLVFVNYSPRHIFQNEWVWNAADIDSARVVWARDLGQAEDDKLRAYYPQRAAWILEADATPPRLARYGE